MSFAEMRVDPLVTLRETGAHHLDRSQRDQKQQTLHIS
jgi:hypothetical protein